MTEHSQIDVWRQCIHSIWSRTVPSITIILQVRGDLPTKRCQSISWQTNSPTSDRMRPTSNQIRVVLYLVSFWIYFATYANNMTFKRHPRFLSIKWVHSECFPVTADLTSARQVQRMSDYRSLYPNVPKYYLTVLLVRIVSLLWEYTNASFQCDVVAATRPYMAF